MKNILFIVVLFISSSFTLLGQTVADPCRKSTEGTDFWFGFMESRNYNPNHYLEITVTARETTTFTITIGKDETPFNGTYTVNANSSRQVDIPWDMVEATGSESIQDKGIHLVSEKPVNVYALNYDRNSADVAVIYPTNSLGKEYFAMCYDVNISERNDGSYGNGRNSEFLIVASEDSTHVLIIPSKVTDKLVNAGDSIEITLNKGEVYQVQSQNRNGLAGQGDLTQSYVQSDKPVAFYSGSLGTTVPASSGMSAWDHLYEQIPPVHSWGREYYTVPLKSRNEDRYRIIAAEDNTTVTITNKNSIKLNRGDFKEIVLYDTEPSRIYSDKPIMVAQYSQSNRVDGTGDPFMIILSSVTQSKNDVTFVAYDSDIIQNYYVNIITLTEEINNIRLDNNSISNSFKAFPEGDYSFAQMNINPGTHRIYNTNPDRGFLAYVYGYGGVESYGYGVGFNLDLVLDLGESIDFNGDTLLLCNGETVTLDAGPYFDTYNWNTDDTTQTVDVLTGGMYKVETTTIDGCELEDSIYVYVSSPEVDLGVTKASGCYPFSIDLNGGDGYEKYLWQNQKNDTLSTSQYYTASNVSNKYRVTVYDEYSCTASDTMELVVFPVPKIEIEGKNLVCLPEAESLESYLTVKITDAPESVWNYEGSYTWSSEPRLTFTNESHENVQITAPTWGEYEIYYQLKTIDDCLTSDTFKVIFQPQPKSDFTFEDDAKCEGYSKKLLFEGIATESAHFFWDLDGCQFVDTIIENKIYDVSVGAFVDKQPYIKLVIDDNGCWSDTTIHPLGAKPNFTMDADVTRGCDELTVKFTSKLLTNDNVDFVWTFDDIEIIESQNVEKFYPDTGFYKVALTITNPITQCQNGFTIDSMIKVFPTPTAEITADVSLCYPDSAQISYAHYIDSSFCHWNFEGAHQSGSGNEVITMIIDEPFGKAILTVDEYGCLSPPADVTLKRLPHFDFNAEYYEGCQPLSIEVFAESKDDFLDFIWLTDSLPYPSGNSTVFLLPDSGRIDISAIANSQETGCYDTLVKADWIWVHPKPIANFEVDYPVALLEHSTITYTNLSEFANYYFWDFGDNFTSVEENPQHTFTKLGEFNSQLFAESEFNCKDTAEFLIKILPFSVFTPNAFRPDSEIEENRTFMPVGVGADPSRFDLQIYDRWGKIVFETNTPDYPWDGTTKSGEAAPMGNYVWISHYYDIQGFEHNQKGQVVLVR